jgi:hypothetical protein
MSLQTICVNVAQDLGIDEPTPPIFGSRLPAAKRLVAQARRALRSLSWRASWANLVIEHQFTANGQSDYALPADFLKVINDTVWERTRYWAMRGALSPQTWQRYRSSIYGRATIWRRWRIRVPSGENVGSPAMFSIDPLVAATDFTSQFVFEYQSSYTVQHADGTLSADWTADTDTSILSEFLIELGTRWRMLRRLGLAYDDERDEYEREVDKAVARSGGMMTLNLVPFQREDFIGQYSLGAFPPVGTPPVAAGPAMMPPPPLPPDIARLIAPMERPDWLPPPDLSRPPPMPPRPPVRLAPSAAELLARAPPQPVIAAPQVRRLRWRHQAALTQPIPAPVTAPLAAPTVPLDPELAARQPGTPYPPADLARQLWSPAPPARREYLDGGPGDPLAPKPPEPQLPPGT